MAFKAITVNTPAADPAHILAEDDAALYESLVGGDKVLNVGGKLAATTISNNKIRITDGVVIVGGHVGRIYKGDYEDLTIENGTSGQNRNDLIVARYLAGNSGGADSYGLAVIKGTPGSTATDPIYMQGNLYNGDPQRDFPLYRAKLEGLSIVAVEQLFEVGKTIGELEEEIETLNSKLQDTGWVNCSLGYGMSVAGGRTPQVRRIGNVVHMRGRIVTSTQWTQHDSIVTIPEGFRPSRDEAFIQSSTGTYRYRIEVMQAGNVVANAITNNTNGNAETTAGYWFALSCTWFLE